MKFRNTGSHAKEIITITIIALKYLEKGAGKVIKIIEALASTPTVGYAAMMFLASLIRGSPAAV